jgi:hypothetical protein
MAIPARAAAVAAAASAAIVIAGCGGGSPTGSPSPPASSSGGGANAEPSATALVTSMQSSVRQAKSVHVSGHLTNNGIPISVNLDMHRNGDVSGTVSENGAPFQVIGLNSTIYIKATRLFLQQVKAPTSACAVVCGRWLQLTPSQATQLTGDLSMSSLTGPLTSGQVPKLTKAGSKAIDGQNTWALRAADGSKLYVSSASQHYPLAATSGGGPNEVVLYSRWNSAPEPVAPPANQVLNLNKLK